MTQRDHSALPFWFVFAVCLATLPIAFLTGPLHATTSRPFAPLPSSSTPNPSWMPPGSDVSPLPSDAIFPRQTLSVRFDHKKHVQEFDLTCKVCHQAAYKSDASSDRLLPAPEETCDNCHDVDHSDRLNVKRGDSPNGQCAFCHVGYQEGKSVLPVVIPAPNLKFPHKKHLVRNIQCAQCHGQVDQFEMATREQLPRMAGCFTCHAMSGAGSGDAKGACMTCHLTEPGGRMITSFASGRLSPPQWLRGAEHTPDWTERHKNVAAADSQLCANCHTASECTECHDGRVRNRKVHPNDWLSMHPQAARQDNPRCVSCHQQQTFCADCHRRVGVARDVASGNRPSGRRFHPPPDVWTTAPRSPIHHSWEAMRNLNACVSCHTERDCATCHATKGRSGGQGVSPHPAGFASRCGAARRKNPRPCLVCHQSNDPSLSACR